MVEYSIDTYKSECMLLLKGLRGKRAIAFILKTYFPEVEKEERTKLRTDIVNIINGNSYSKAIQLEVMPIFKEVYLIKTGKQFFNQNIPAND